MVYCCFTPFRRLSGRRCWDRGGMLQLVLGQAWTGAGELSCCLLSISFNALRLCWILVFFWEAWNLEFNKFEFEALLAARSKAGSQWLDKVGTVMRLARQSGSIYCLHMLMLGLPAKEQTEHSEQRGQSAGGAGATGTTLPVRRAEGELLWSVPETKYDKTGVSKTLHDLTRIICLSSNYWTCKGSCVKRSLGRYLSWDLLECLQHFLGG